MICVMVVSGFCCHEGDTKQRADLLKRNQINVIDLSIGDQLHSADSHSAGPLLRDYVYHVKERATYTWEQRSKKRI